MKKIYFAILSFVLIGNVGYTQIIRPTSVYFSSNLDITNYFTAYPYVTQLDYVGIGGGVSSLGALNQLTDIGELEIYSGFSLSGLNNVETISGSTNYNGNVRILSNFSGLNGLTSIAGNLTIQATVSGFTNLNTINGNSIFFGNYPVPTAPIVTSMPTFASLSNFTGSIEIRQTNISSISFSNLCSPREIYIHDNENLTSITGFNNSNVLEELYIVSNPNLTSINAFSGLQSISERLRISENPSLQTITGYGNLTNVSLYQFFGNGCQHLPNTPLLTSIGSLFIDNNPSLIDLSGLNGLTTINDTFSLLGNNALATLSHLGNLTTVGGIFSVNNCDSLANFSGSANPQLDGLNNLTTVGGDLIIDNNDALTSLSGLGNISTGTIDAVAIRNNPLLTTCAIQSVCDKIAQQSNTVFIGPNGANCNSAAEITTACNPIITPTFTAIEPICSGISLSPLPTTSNNGIIGTWSPAFDNSTTTEYTFTPNAGQNASSTTLTITVNSTLAPTASAQTFNFIATVASLAATGNNLQWYDVAEDGSSLNTSTPLVTGTYYVSQTINGCESSRTAVAVTISNLPIVSTPVTYCRGAIATPLSAVAAAGSTLKWYTAATGGTGSLTAPTPSTAYVGTRNYYVSQTVNGVESARVLIAVIVDALPATPGAIAGTAAQGPLVGTTTLATYSIAPVTGATAYEWTAPAGVNIIGANNGTSVTVNFLNVSAGAGIIGNLSVKAINSNGCKGTARNLALTKALPVAPSGIKMYDDAFPTFSTSTGLQVAVTSFAKYMGTNRVLRLTATQSLTATSYVWELPAGVNQLSGGTSNEITVNFSGVTSGNTFSYTTSTGVLTHALRIGVKSSNGVGLSFKNNAALLNPDGTTTTSPALLSGSSSTLLTFKATLPAAVSTVTGQITGVCGGRTYEYTITKASPWASSYVITAPAGSVVTSVTGVSGMTPNIWSTSDLTFSVTYPVGFVGNTVATPQTIVISSVNGVGSSIKVKTLAISKAVAAVGVATGSAGIASFTRCATQTFTVPTVVGATTYVWTPANGAVIVSGQGTTSVEVDFSAVLGTVVSTKLTVAAKNVCNVSSATKTITLGSTACPVAPKMATPSIISTVSIYPNPASSIIFIETTNNSMIEKVVVIDLLGKVIFEGKPENNQINVERFAAGTYILQSFSGEERFTRKFIKE